jgi:amino acid transporter
VLVLYLGYKYIKKTKVIPLEQIPIRPLLDIAHADPLPPIKAKKSWKKLNILW